MATSRPSTVRRVLQVALLVAVAAGGWSQTRAAQRPIADFGLTLNNGAGFAYEQIDTDIAAATAGYVLDDGIDVTLWTSWDFAESYNLLARASYSLSYSLDYGVEIAPEETLEHLVTLDALRLTGELGGGDGGQDNLVFTVGRFEVAEFSGWVLRHTVDGLRVRLATPLLELGFYSGFTGLLFANQSGVVLTKADSNTVANADMWTLATPRLLAGLNLTFPELVARQDVNLSVVYQQELRELLAGSLWPVLNSGGNPGSLVAEGDTDFSDIGATFSSVYAGLGATGLIAVPFYYDALAYFSYGRSMSFVTDAGSPTGSSYVLANHYGLLGKLGVRLFLPEVLSTRVELNLVVSSGDIDYSGFYEGNSAGDAWMFVPVTQPPLALVYSAQLGNLAMTEINYSLRPFADAPSQAARNVQAVLKGAAFWRMTTGAIFDSGIDPGSASPYLGTEIDVILNFRPLSDLGIGLTNGVFFPQGSAYDASQQGIDYRGRLTLSFSF